MNQQAAAVKTPAGHRHARVPVILQMEVAECGAACLAALMARAGCHRTLEEVRRTCGVNRDGSNALAIVEAARYYGFDADGLSVTPEELADLQLPLILHWGFNHFVVLEGWRGGRWLIMDPAAGRRWVSAQELHESFTGVVLEVVPGERFAPSGRSPSAWGALRRRIDGSWTAVAAATVAGAILAVPGLIIPGLSAVFVDRVLGEARGDWLAGLVAIALVAILLQGVVAWVQRLVLVRLEQRMAVATTTGFVAAILRLPIDFFVHRLPGDLVHRVAANDSISGVIAGRYAPAIIALGMSLAYLAALLAVDPLLGSLAALAAASIAALMAYASRATADAARSEERERSVRSGTLAAGLDAIETVKACGREADFFARTDGAGARVRMAQQRAQVLTEGLHSLPGLVEATFASAVVLSVGGWKVMQGEMSLGALLAFQTVLMGFLAPVVQLAALWQEVQESRADLSRLDDVLRHNPDPMTGESTADAPTTAPRGELELVDVTFGYAEALGALVENFSLHVRPGRRLALVGGTGSGKTTLGRLAAGLLQPWSGEVRLDGRPLASWSRHDRSTAMATVSQAVILFEGTVRDNLTLWDSTVPERWLREAIEDAQMSELLAVRGGLDATVSEGGSNFSGGEVQRLEIARALARRPALLILDEATSALDSATEQAIDQALQRRGVACLIIAHRLSTVRDADEIIVLSGGGVVERGRHDELIAAGGAYAELVGGMS